MARGSTPRTRFRRPAASLARAAVVAAALAVPRPGAAQQVALPTVPWGASPSVVSAAVQQLGFKVDSIELTGLSFARFSAGPTVLAATFGASGLFMLNQIHALPPPQARQRFQELRDSLVKVLGEPDSVGTRPVWVRPDGRILLWVRPDSGRLGSAAILSRARPNYAAELAAAYREAMRQVEADPVRWIEARLDTIRWKPLARSDSQAVALDKTRVDRRSGDTWRIWVRWDYRVPVTTPSRIYDLVVQALEIGCAEGTYRPGESVSMLRGRNAALLTSRWGTRSRPAPPSVEAEIVARFCAYAREPQPQVEPSPGRP